MDAPAKPARIDLGEAFIDRARHIAMSQCTDGEIAAKLAREHCVVEIYGPGVDVDVAVFLDVKRQIEAWLTENSELVDSWRFEGRATVRLDLYELLRTPTREGVKAAELWGRQHLGYTSEGFDQRIRKAAEKAERARKGRR